MNQELGLHQAPELGEMSVCCVSYPVYSILLWQPELTQTGTHMLTPHHTHTQSSPLHTCTHTDTHIGSPLSPLFLWLSWIHIRFHSHTHSQTHMFTQTQSHTYAFSLSLTHTRPSSFSFTHAFEKPTDTKHPLCNILIHNRYNFGEVKEYFMSHP